MQQSSSPIVSGAVPVIPVRYSPDETYDGKMTCSRGHIYLICKTVSMNAGHNYEFCTRLQITYRVAFTK